MTAHTNHETANGMNRRGFVKGAASLTFAFTLGGGLLSRSAQALAADSSRLNAWITIGSDGTVHVALSDGGNGPGRADIAAAGACRRARCRLVESEGGIRSPIPPLYGNPHPFFNGAQVTAGSTSVPGYFPI